MSGHQGLGRFIQWLIEASQARLWVKVSLTIQDGQIKFVHVDQSFKLEDLPIRDVARLKDAGLSAPNGGKG